MPEGEKLWGGPVVMVGIICPPPVGIGLTDLPNIGGASGPPGPPSSGTTASHLKTMGRGTHYAHHITTCHPPCDGRAIH